MTMGPTGPSLLHLREEPDEGEELVEAEWEREQVASTHSERRGQLCPGAACCR